MRGKRILRWGLLLLCCGVIFWGTGDPHFTGESTHAVVAHAAPSIGVATARQLDWLNLAIRKATHMLLFGTLGAVAWQAFRSWPGGRRAAAWAWLFTTIYAASDEWHQHFVPGRTASAWDVLLDSAAAALVLLIVPYMVHHLGTRKAEPRP